MTRYVIGPDVANRLAHERAVIRVDHQILAPTLLRSQLLSLLSLITLDEQLANAVRHLVAVAPVEALSLPQRLV